MSSNASYTNLAAIKSYWLNTIAPNYLDFSNTNNYNVGVFGYINEIMANTTEDAFNATAIARREFYPVTAQFTSSLYTMATLQSIDIPLTTPATCRCALIIPQDDIIEYSTYNDGIYECTIDNVLKIHAGDLQFMLDYPIKIISKKIDKWVHTVHYDISVSNSLNTSSDGRYLSNKVIMDSGVNYVILFVDVVRQLEMTEISNVLIKDTIMDTVAIDIDFDGNLANFEVFYKETSNSAELQLSKVLVNAVTPKIPYVQYEIVGQNKVRLIFAFNTIFNPQFNSEIICRVYTSLGAAGNFNSYNSDLSCSSDSEKYPYNTKMTIFGRINGSSSGGADQPLLDDFRNTILKAYSTNNTITTSQDLQLRYDELADSVSNIKILFKKKRDDALIRLFGAYCVMKDESEYVVPTNTLSTKFLKSDFIEDLQSGENRITVPPGTVFEYESDSSYNLVIARNADNSLKTLREVVQENDISKIYFINPFLMGINLSPNTIGYYMVSVDKYMSIDYTYVNDDSSQQFIGSTVRLYRNSISGSDFYTFTISITPATEIDATQLITIPDTSLTENQIIAEYNGTVVSEQYYYDTSINQGYIRFTIEYDGVSEADRYLYIQASNTSPIGKTSVTGYEMQYSVGDQFVSGAILATKRVSDLGNLVLVNDLNHILFQNKYYFVMSIQKYDSELNSYTMEGYLATSDNIDISEQITINHGIFRDDGTEDTFIAIDMRDQLLIMNVLYNNPGANIPNQYTYFEGMNNFTLTNTYASDESDKFDFVGSLPFIRSVVDFYPGGTAPEDYTIFTSEVPVIGAIWGADNTQYDYFISQYSAINDRLTTAFYELENNFNIDSKFYNTYGKARFFTVGNNQSSMEKLDTVKCRFRFGLSLATITSTDQFIDTFKDYVKDYIEDDDRITTVGQDVYIMNMIADIKQNFPEINYIEYYGFNSYDESAQKVAGPNLSDFQDGFIPEFLNLDIVTGINGEKYPNVSVALLD